MEGRVEQAVRKIDGVFHFVGHSHIDAAWLWPISETVEVCRETFESILQLMERYPAFCFSQSSAQYYKWMEKEHPETFDKIRRRVKEGRWEIVGGMWVESDCNMPSGESLVRQFLYGKRYFKKKFDVEVKIAWLFDAFGYAHTLPQIMKKSGVQYFLTQKMNWNDTTVFPYNVFHWFSPDGSSVLAHQIVGGYSEAVVKETLVAQLATLKRRHRIRDLLVLFGVGDHGGGVTQEMLDRAAEIIKQGRPARGRFSTAEEYFDMLAEASRQKRFPAVNDELYLQYHRGAYTTQARVKKNNRDAERLLEVAEKFSVIAQQYDLKYPKKELDEAWEKLLLNQFHDILPGSSIPEVYQESERDFKAIFDSTESIISKAIKTIAVEIDTLGEGASILVFNPLSWQRDGLVEIPLSEVGHPGGIEIHDEKGRLIPSQVIHPKKGDKVLFTAERVPPIGYKEYKITSSTKNPETQTSLSATEVGKEITLRNQFCRVDVDAETGLLRNIYDETNERDILRENGNFIQIFDDHPAPGRRSIVAAFDAALFDAWETYIYQQPQGIVCTELNHPTEVRLLETGPVRGKIQAKYRYSQRGRPESIFIQEIVLHDKMPLIEFRLHIDWHAEHRLAKVAFPLNVYSDFTTYEVPYGFVARRDPRSPRATLSERAKYEVPGQKWIDHTSEDGSYGVSLLNDSKYGFDSVDNTLRMTLLRSANHPSIALLTAALEGRPTPETELTDQGQHDIAYAIYPHSGDHSVALTPRKAYEFNYPLIAHVESSHAGSLPKTHSFISAGPGNVILTVVKRAEDSEDIILRLYETSGKDAKAVIHMHRPPSSVHETDMLENKMSEILVHDNTIEISLGKHEIKTLKVTFPEQR